MAVGGVQGLTLAFSGVGQGALEEPDPLGIELAHHVRRAVLGGVVDDHDLEVAGNGQQPLQAPGDHLLLVQAGDEEDEQQVVRSRQRRIPVLSGQHQQPEAVQGRERDEGEGDPGDHVSLRPDPAERRRSSAFPVEIGHIGELGRAAPRSLEAAGSLGPQDSVDSRSSRKPEGPVKLR